jgi:hypothetical protein
MKTRTPIETITLANEQKARGSHLAPTRLTAKLTQKTFRKLTSGLALAFTLIGLSAGVVGAQEIIPLTSTEAQAKGDDAIVVRDARTPDKVKLQLEIPFGESVCVRYETRYETVRDSRCGYDVIPQYRRVCSTRTVCEVSRNGVCQRSRNETVCRDVPSAVRVPRVCTLPYTYCAQHSVERDIRARNVTLDFSKLSNLEAGQEQRIRIRGKQKRLDSAREKFSASVLESAGKNIKVKEKRRKIVFKD